MEFNSLATKPLSVFIKVSLLLYQIFPVSAKTKLSCRSVPGCQNAKSAKKLNNYNIK